MKRIDGDQHEDLAEHGAGVRLEQLVDDPERHAADQRAPQVADAAEHHHHERVDDVGLSEVGTDVGQLAERHAGHAGDAGAEAERHRVHPLAANAHRARHRAVLRHGADVEAQPRALEHDEQDREHEQREDDDVETVVGERQALR